MSQLVSATGALIRWTASGFVVTSQTEQANRRSICQVCEHHDTVHDKCNECNCFLAAKIRMATEACPLGLWESTIPGDRQNGPRIDSEAFMTIDQADRLIAQAEAAMQSYDPQKGGCCG